MYNVLKTVGQALSLGGVRGGKKAGIRLVLSKIERSTIFLGRYVGIIFENMAR